MINFRKYPLLYSPLAEFKIVTDLHTQVNDDRIMQYILSKAHKRNFTVCICVYLKQNAVRKLLEIDFVGCVVKTSM